MIVFISILKPVKIKISLHCKQLSSNKYSTTATTTYVHWITLEHTHQCQNAYSMDRHAK